MAFVNFRGIVLSVTVSVPKWVQIMINIPDGLSIADKYVQITINKFASIGLVIHPKSDSFQSRDLLSKFQRSG